jgi:hypothetical protein
VISKSRKRRKRKEITHSLMPIENTPAPEDISPA